MSNSIVLFINDGAVKLNNLFLNEDWQLTKIADEIDNVFTITVNGKKLDWMVKRYTSQKHAQKESSKLNKLKTVENVPKILAAGLSKKLNYIIISRAPGMDLYDYVSKYGNFTEETIRPIVKQLLLVLKEIHKHQIIHKDIKPENIVYDKNNNQLTLIDFECKQTEEYYSPEQARKQIVTEKTDLWSVGTTIYFLVSGNHPFKNRKELFQKQIVYSKNWSALFEDFLSHLLERDVDARYSVKDALKHPWFR